MVVKTVDFTNKRISLEKYLYFELKRHRNIFLTGGGGVGKSYLVRRLRKLYKNPLVFGSTNQSSILVGGVTIHDFFKLYTTKTIKQLEARISSSMDKLRLKHPHMTSIQLRELFFKDEIAILKKADVIIIDEISMLGKSVFGLFYYQLASLMSPSAFRDIPILIVGDFYQLQPVNDMLAFDSKYFTDFKTIELTEIKRTTSKNFIKVLNSVREGKNTPLVRDMLGYFEAQYKRADKEKLKENSIYLYPTNKEVQEHNEYMLSKIEEGDIKSYCDIAYKDREVSRADIEKFIQDSQFEDTFKFKIGAKVVFIASNTSKGFYNGLQGVIVAKYKDDRLNICVKVKLDTGKVLDIIPYPFQLLVYKKMSSGRLQVVKILEVRQLPLKISYSMTIHKSQGLSIKGNMILDC